MLELESVSRTFGGLKAVDGVSLTVRAGDRRAVIGPNGAGKTTLFNLISGELKATAGAIRLSGSDVTSLAPFERAALGIARTFQMTRLFAHLTVLENTLLSCAALDRRKFTMHRPLMSCTPLTERASAVLDEFGLWPVRGQPAHDLSYGDQRRLEVALALAGRPRLVLLDEPMAGLAANERDMMQRLLEKLDRDIAVLLIEHDMDVAFGFADTVTVLDRGRVLAEGSKEQIAANPAVQQIYLGVHAG